MHPKHSLIHLSIFHLMVSTARAGLFAYVPRLFENLLGNLWLVGLILSIPWLLNVFFDTIIGKLNEKFSPRLMLTTSMVLLILVSVLYYISGNLIIALAALFLYGFAVDLYMIPAYSSLLHFTPEKRSSFFDAVFYSSGALGWTLGPLIAGFIFSHFLNKDVFIFSGLAFAATFIYCVFTFSSKPIARKTQKFKLSQFIQGITSIKRLSPLLRMSYSLIFITTFIDDLLNMITPLYIFSLNIDPLYVGLTLAAFSAPSFLIRLPAGFLEDFSDKTVIILPVLVVMGVLVVLLSILTHPLFIVPVAFFIATCHAILGPAIGGIIIAENAYHHTSMNASLRIILENSATVSGYILGTLAAFFFGYQIMYFLIGAGIFTTVIILRNRYPALSFSKIIRHSVI
ncbi:MAG: MFS transporter [Nanoarchaeota archaeon]